MDNFKITKTILENINEQNDRINECVDIVNGYTTDEATRVNQELQRQENELRREEQYNNNEKRFANVEGQMEFKANLSKTNLLTLQVEYIEDFINNNLSTSKELITNDLINYGTTSSIDSNKNLLISKSGSQSFTWVVFNKDTLNSEFEFTMNSNNVYFVLCANAEKCVAIQLGVNSNDFGLATRWKANGGQENISVPHTDQTLKAVSGDVIKVKRLPDRWKFYKNGNEWIDVTYTLYQANFLTEFIEEEFRYGIMKYKPTENESISKNWKCTVPFVLPTSINNYEGKVWNAIGDSITWLDKYEPIVANALKLDSYRNYGKSGFSTVMLKGDIDSWDNNADLITFFAGTNDFGRCDDLSTTETSVDYIFSNLKTKYPNKIICVFLPLQRWGYTGDTVQGSQSTMTNSKGITLRQYCDVIYNKAKQYNFKILDLYYESGITKDNINTYTADGLHPNDLGFSLIANVMIEFLKNI